MARAQVVMAMAGRRVSREGAGETVAVRVAGNVNQVSRTSGMRRLQAALQLHPQLRSSMAKSCSCQYSCIRRVRHRWWVGFV